MNVCVCACSVNKCELIGESKSFMGDWKRIHCVNDYREGPCVCVWMGVCLCVRVYAAVVLVKSCAFSPPCIVILQCFSGRMDAQHILVSIFSSMIHQYGCYSYYGSVTASRQKYMKRVV